MAPKVDVTKLAHDLLTKARDHGHKDTAWSDIFKQLRKTPGALARPAPRKMNLLHQAAYWGKWEAMQTLLKEFSATAEELTNDDPPQDAGAVAEAEGHADVAEKFKAYVAHAKAAKAKAATGSAAAGRAPPKPSADDVKLAHELLTKARDEGGSDEVWEEMFKQLRERPAAVQRPEVRKFSLLHQAAHWGRRKAVETLVKEFGCDPKDTTADGQNLTAAQVADAEKHKDVAEYLRSLEAGGEATAAVPMAVDDAAAKPAADEKAAADDDGSAASSPYAADKAKNAEEDMPGAVTVWLQLSKDKTAWTPFSAAQNEGFAAGLKGVKTSVSFSGGTLDTEALTWTDDKAGKTKACSHQVCWEWDSGEGGKAAPVWKRYEPKVQWELEAAICQAHATCTVKPKDAKGGPASKGYVIDLVGMRQRSAKDDFRCRRIRRRGVPLRTPFPNKMLDDASGTWLDLSAKPDYWPGGVDAYTNALAKRHDLDPGCPQYALICDWINASIRTGHAAAYGQVPGGGATMGMEVERIEVVWAPAIWRRYSYYKGLMKTHGAEIKAHAGTKYLKKQPMAMPTCEWLDSDVNESYFWHGSGKSPDGSVDLIDAIVTVGCEPSDENSENMELTEVADGASSRFAKNTSMFGSGVYLADLSSKANLYVPCPLCHQGAYFRDPCFCSPSDVEKGPCYRMLLCRAVMGRVYIENKYTEKRYKGDFNPAKKLEVDSVMGEAKKGQLAFREYVVYNDSASYPEFIVHYRRRGKSLKGGAPFGFPPFKKAKK
eukprot:TRINITY_DN12266_c0_g1_i1.p1 TRINITY_DN12266_c0_g1~~TRINITY_DN12266_c0_g1_i1.p1  ORF type:complete len:771 (+),score=212.07 TRINITY_DN12266_c0_g1_i1:66-2378(+)